MIHRWQLCFYKGRRSSSRKPTCSLVLPSPEIHRKETSLDASKLVAAVVGPLHRDWLGGSQASSADPAAPVGLTAINLEGWLSWLWAEDLHMALHRAKAYVQHWGPLVPGMAFVWDCGWTAIWCGADSAKA